MLTHTVKKGESLWQIAQQYQITLDGLLAANPQLSDPNYILPGININIPELIILEPPTPAMPIDTNPCSCNNNGNNCPNCQINNDIIAPPSMDINQTNRPFIYYSQNGDSLLNLAEKLNIPLAQLHYHNYQYPKNTALSDGEPIIIPAANNYRPKRNNYGYVSANAQKRRK